MAIFIPLVTKFDDKGLKGAERALAGFQNFAVDVGRVAAAAVAAVGVASVREAAKFETTFAKIEGLVGLTKGEIVELEEAARRLGPQFGASGNEAGEALFFITSAGLRGAAAVNVLEASLKGAAIGLGDAKTIADLATSAVNAYGESNLDGAQAVDVLAEAVRLGKLEPADLAASLGDVLPLASVLGVRFDEVGAAMAGMSKTGTDAATASTQLRGIFNTLVGPTVEAEEALAEMGLSAAGLRDQIKEKGLFNTLETLTDAFDGNIAATASVFGNVRALTGVLDLMGPSLEDNRELFALMADDIGVLDDAFDIVSETSEFKFNKALETAKDSLIGIGGAILDNVNPLLEDFALFFEENREPIEQTFIAIFDAVNNLVVALKGLLDEKILPFLKTIFEDERFAKGVASIAAGFGVIAVESDRFVNSDLGGFLADITKESILNGLGQLGRNLENIAIFLGVINDTIALLQGKGGTTTFAQLKQLGQDAIRGVSPGAAIADQIFNAILGGRTDRATDIPLKGRRAGGGPVSSSRSFLVGEMGPELFTPAAGGGTITANNQLGATTFNITVNAGVGTSGAQVGETIVNLIRKYERTSGPVFARA